MRGTLLGGTDLRYTDVAFSRDGARVAAFGNRTDHLATVWNVKKASADEEELTGEKVYTSLRSLQYWTTWQHGARWVTTGFTRMCCDAEPVSKLVNVAQAQLIL